MVVGAKVSLCMLCPEVNMPSVDEPGMAAFRTAPIIPLPLLADSLNQPLRPCGMNVSKRGVKRGNPLPIELRYWQEVALKLKLKTRSVSS